jgi:hypothetical protein
VTSSSAVVASHFSAQFSFRKSRMLIKLPCCACVCVRACVRACARACITVRLETFPRVATKRITTVLQLEGTRSSEVGVTLMPLNRWFRNVVGLWQ